MMSEGDQPTSSILVLADTADDDGTMWRAIVLYADDCLAIQGYDTGAGVQRAHGADDYEFARELSPGETDRLRGLLGIGGGNDLLAALGKRFATAAEIEEFLVDRGIPGDFSAWTYRD